MKNCPICNEQNEALASICQRCEFLFDSSDSEKTQFIAGIEKKRGFVRKGEKQIQNARHLLYGMAGLTGLNIILPLIFDGTEHEFLFPNIILMISFVLLGNFSSRWPILMIVVGILFYIGIIVYNNYLYPGSIFSDMLMKLVIFIVLFSSLYFAIQGEKSRNLLEKKYDWLRK